MDDQSKKKLTSNIIRFSKILKIPKIQKKLKTFVVVFVSQCLQKKMFRIKIKDWRVKSS